MVANPVEGHSFYAVPITTLEVNNKKVYLCDIACALKEDLKLTSDEWYEVLKKAIDQKSGEASPLIIIVHGWYTGNNEVYNYWQPFVDFLDLLEGRATFVTTKELVDLNNN